MAEIFAATCLVLAAGISAIASILVAKLRTENTTRYDAALEGLVRNGAYLDGIASDLSKNATRYDAALEGLVRNGARLEGIASDLSEVKADVTYTKKAHDRHIEWHIEGKKPR